MSTADGVAELLLIAEMQHGVVTRAQLERCGLSGKTATRLAAEGWLRRVRRGAYAVGGRLPSPWEQAVAACLAGGPGCALSHLTAAVIHQFPHVAPGPVPEMSVVEGRNPRLASVQVHRVARLDACDVIARGGVHLTGPARTMVDLATRFPPPLVARIIDEGAVQRLWTPEDLREANHRTGGSGRRGTRLLDRLLAERTEVLEGQSALERRVIRVLDPLAPFETQHQLVLGGQVIILDIAWPWWRVGVEVDGWWVRSRSRTKFDGDRRRNNLLAAHGWRIAHVTSAMDDETILSDVCRILPPEALSHLVLDRVRSPRGRSAGTARV